jgi:hypothetical protein
MSRSRSFASWAALLIWLLAMLGTEGISMRVTGKPNRSSPRQKALKKGATRYFTGEPCKHGHVAELITSNSVCVVCDSKRHAQWHRANKKKENEARRQRYQKRRNRKM